MSNSIHRFFDAWGLEDAAARADAIADALSAQARYADPRSGGVLEGPDAIADYVGMFNANAPGWRAEVVKSDEISGVHRVTVAFGGKGPDGTEMVQHGQYFAELDDGRITRLIGFVGTGEPE